MNLKDFQNSRLALIAVVALLVVAGGIVINLESNSDQRTAPSTSDSNQNELENRSNSTSGEQLADDNNDTSTTYSSQKGSENVSFDGEEDFEEFLGSSVSAGDPDVDKPGYHWVEFENSSNQLTQPVPDELPNKVRLDYIIKENLRTEGLGEFDSLYLVIEKDYQGEGPKVTHYFFVEDEWNSSLSAEENMGSISGHFYGLNAEETDLSVLETLLSENVEDYDEVSRDFPREYLSWIEE